MHAFSITPPSCQLAGEIIIPFKYKHFADSATDESRSEESASNNEGINEERSCSAPPNKLPKLSNPDDQAGVSGIEALPDEVLVEVFENFSLKEMLKTLCLVSRRWRHIVNNNNILWSCLLLDEWHITYLSEEQFMNIMSHSSGFRYLSIRYIEMTTSEMRLEALLGNSIEFFKHLRYLDLSGQPISSFNFLLIESSPPETLILNDSQKIDTCCCIAILKQLRNLRILSLNRVGFTATQVATITASLCLLNVLCLVGVSLAREDIRLILQKLNHLQFFEISCSSEDKEHIYALGEEYDVRFVCR